MKRFLTLSVLLTVLIMTLPACHSRYQDVFDDGKDNVREFAMICEDGELSKLDEYPNLEYVDLRGSTCYDEILAYAAQHPDITVRYSVSLGGSRFNQNVTEIDVNCFNTNYDDLLANLKYLPDLKHVHLDQVTFTSEQLNKLKETYPQIPFSYSVQLLGKRYESDITELDLSHLTPTGLDEAITALSLLGNLECVTLSDDFGYSHLSIAEFKRLMEAFPNIKFDYIFTLFGQKVSAFDEKLEFDSVAIGNNGVAQIREALDIMRHCKVARFDSCGIDNEVMAQLRSDYPNMTIAWRVFADRYSIMTDEEMLRMPYNLNNETAQVLKYCTGVKYLDMINCKITNIDFVANMPNLECAIFTVTAIEDLSPLANCPNLTWLELSSCSFLEDLTPLSGLRNLKYLNISSTDVKDLSALAEVPIERLNTVKSDVDGSDLKAFAAKHPNCTITSKGSKLNNGWRYEDNNQKIMFPYYAKIREIFRYDEKGYFGSHKE